jgi:hypothetical protein
VDLCAATARPGLDLLGLDLLGPPGCRWICLAMRIKAARGGLGLQFPQLPSVWRCVGRRVVQALAKQLQDSAFLGSDLICLAMCEQSSLGWKVQFSLLP